MECSKKNIIKNLNSKSKYKKINPIKKNWMEKDLREKLKDSKPHSNLERLETEWNFDLLNKKNKNFKIIPPTKTTSNGFKTSKIKFSLENGILLKICLIDALSSKFISKIFLIYFK